MKITKTGEAGAAESSDILVTVSPSDEPGVQVNLTGKSVILKQFGRQIREMIATVAAQAGLEQAKISAQDNGALDCTIKARVRAAIQRAM